MPPGLAIRRAGVESLSAIRRRCSPTPATTCLREAERDSSGRCFAVRDCGSRSSDADLAVRCSCVLRGRAPQRQFRDGNSARAQGDAGESEIHVPRRARSRECASGLRLPDQQFRTGVAPVVLSVEQHPGRRTAGGRRRRHACTSGRSRTPGEAYGLPTRNRQGRSSATSRGNGLSFAI